MSDALVNLFGDKSWYKSLTAWGVLVFTFGQAYCAQGVVEGVDVLPFAAQLCVFTNWAGAVLATLGIRRAQNGWEE